MQNCMIKYYFVKKYVNDKGNKKLLDNNKNTEG